MTRRSRREIERLLAELDTSHPPAFALSSDVVTVTDDMTDESGSLVEDPADPEGEILATESDVVTVWAECMD